MKGRRGKTQGGQSEGSIGEEIRRDLDCGGGIKSRLKDLLQKDHRRVVTGVEAGKKKNKTNKQGFRSPTKDDIVEA